MIDNWIKFRKLGREIGWGREKMMKKIGIRKDIKEISVEEDWEDKKERWDKDKKRGEDWKGGGIGGKLNGLWNNYKKN